MWCGGTLQILDCRLTQPQVHRRAGSTEARPAAIDECWAQGQALLDPDLSALADADRLSVYLEELRVGREVASVPVYAGLLEREGDGPARLEMLRSARWPVPEGHMVLRGRRVLPCHLAAAGDRYLAGIPFPRIGVGASLGDDGERTGRSPRGDGGRGEGERKYEYDHSRSGSGGRRDASTEASSHPKSSSRRAHWVPAPGNVTSEAWRQDSWPALRHRPRAGPSTKTASSWARRRASRSRSRARRSGAAGTSAS